MTTHLDRSVRGKDVIIFSNISVFGFECRVYADGSGEVYSSALDAPDDDGQISCPEFDEAVARIKGRVLQDAKSGRNLVSPDYEREIVEVVRTEMQIGRLVA
ncbi:MAG: hypothetical protein HQL31_13825 [Planctomycetes bacterium]|nr:hypothetical protein [Planctomycetota bacterium]